MVTLAELAHHLAVAVPGTGDDVIVQDVTHDSRLVQDGTCFAALVGASVDGHDFVDQARQSGAAAALVAHHVDVDLPQLVVDDTRASAGPAAAFVHGLPTRDLQVVGTTGTNGKTTISWMVESAAAAAGQPTGMLGTVGVRINGQQQPAVRTTPEGPDLQRLLATMRDQRVMVVGMEVSSHGLAMHRVDGTRFAVAVFTNLSQDHLDFHGTMDEYFAAKARLFTPTFTDRAVVGLFDAWGVDMAARSEVPTATIGVDADAVIRLDRVTSDLGGSVGTLHGPAEWLDGHTSLQVRTPLQGRFNLHNAAQALVASIAAGVPAEAAVRGIAAADDVPGRFEVVLRGEVTALVDYAHSPDAIEAVVAALRPTTSGRVLVVVGAGGDRDRDKRAPMGAAAATADVVVFTSDNPRSEEPDAIIRQLLDGAMAAREPGRHTHIEAIQDREAAIARALDMAEPGDVVAVLGKGHEVGQDVGGVVRDFDDREVLARLGGQVRA